MTADTKSCGKRGRRSRQGANWKRLNRLHAAGAQKCPPRFDQNAAGLDDARRYGLSDPQGYCSTHLEHAVAAASLLCKWREHTNM